MNIFRRSLAVGDEVYWTDPDNNISSGVYNITEIGSDSGTIESDDTIVTIENAAGSEAEVFASEIWPNDERKKRHGALLDKIAGRAKAEEMRDLSDDEMQRVFSGVVAPRLCIRTLREFRDEGGTLESLYNKLGGVNHELFPSQE